MPKIVNHEQRKQLIAEATWRVILERGMEGATVRNIAQEAGLSLGALRHYFSTQEELLVYAYTLVKERAGQRIEQIAAEPLPPKEMALQILLQTIPTDPTTRAEMEVWFTFMAYARTKPEMAPAYSDDIFQGIQLLFRQLEEHGLLAPCDKETEMEKLYAIVDGLAVHALLDPERVNKERVTAVLKSQLDQLIRYEGE